MHAARGLAGAPVDVILIDRTNHHLFQPLLYQVATASLAPSDISAPIRWLLRRQENTRVVLGNVSSIDVMGRTVHVDGDVGDVAYDHLIIASGARHSYFGHDEWAASAPGLKTLDDAREIRRRFLVVFEEAELCTDPVKQRELLTFIVIGGGPTGVELAGMFPDVARALRADFRAFDTTSIRTILLEGGDRILPTFPAKLSERAQRDLTTLGVEVRTGARVTGVEAAGVRVGDEFIPAGAMFWAAGNKASSLGKFLGVPLDRAGRVIVNPDLTVPGHEEITVIGDLAACARPNGTMVPGVSPAAIQMGRHAARNLRRRLDGAQGKPFRYVNKGELATIGRHRRSRISGSSPSPVTRRGSSGYSCTSCTSSASATDSWCSSTGGTCTSRTGEGVRLITGAEMRTTTSTGSWPRAPRATEDRPLSPARRGRGGSGVLLHVEAEENRQHQTITRRRGMARGWPK